MSWWASSVMEGILFLPIVCFLLVIMRLLFPLPLKDVLCALLLLV